MIEITTQPREGLSIEDCVFYHTVELPEHGVIEGLWDLRAHTDRYLGNVSLKGKRVLEVGTAGGYLCFYMESQGADVIAFDLAPDEVADIVPYARGSLAERTENMQSWMEKIRNAYWFSHKAKGSKVPVVYGNAYAIPEAIGEVDVAVFGAILLHLRDPFHALASALRLTRQTVIITEPLWSRGHLFRFSLMRGRYSPVAIFVPQAKRAQPPTTWWWYSPAIIQQFISVLGFEESKVSYHSQMNTELKTMFPYFTVVGQRTVPLP
ncbi:MAG: methyltransferase domain-containing protein [Anaerolineae bacterium]|nr:methyltransferase domain-containing protein [Anaerolineae bacterium]